MLPPPAHGRISTSVSHKHGTYVQTTQHRRYRSAHTFQLHSAKHSRCHEPKKAHRTSRSMCLHPAHDITRAHLSQESSRLARSQGADLSRHPQQAKRDSPDCQLHAQLMPRASPLFCMRSARMVSLCF